MATSQIKNIPPPTPANIGTPQFFDFKGVSNPGTPQTLIQVTVPALTQRNLYHVAVRCNMTSSWQLLVGSQVVGSGRMNGDFPESDFFWTPARGTNPGDVITLVFDAILGFPPTDLEAYIQAADVT